MTQWSDKLAPGVQLVDHSENRRVFPERGDRHGVVRSDAIETKQEAEDRLRREAGITMDIETKEIKAQPDTEHKDKDVESGSRKDEHSEYTERREE